MFGIFESKKPEIEIKKEESEAFKRGIEEEEYLKKDDNRNKMPEMKPVTDKTTGKEMNGSEN